MADAATRRIDVIDTRPRFTAADAHMREYDLWVPRDLVASQHEERAQWALEMMENGMSAGVRPTSELALADWLASEPKVYPGRAS